MRPIRNPSRRRLISGAAALAAAAPLNLWAAATNPPGLSRLEIASQIAKSRVKKVLVGNTAFALSENLIDDTTSNSLNSRKICYAPADSAISDIVLGYVGFYLVNPEADFPVTITVKASIEYPLGTTPKQVFFNNGATSATVTPGRTLVPSDPLAFHIPAGAAFAVKTFATWTAGHFYLHTWSATKAIGEWTTRGTGVADNTLNNTTLVTSHTSVGFAPIVYATLRTACPVVAVIGDSIGTLTGDYLDSAVGHNGWGRAMRNKIPFTNLSRAGDSAGQYQIRPEGRNLVVRDAITHLIWEMGSNDLFGGANLASAQASLSAGIDPFLSRGIKVYGATIVPRTTSTDNWTTVGNQTVVSSAVETVRVAYNSWLRSNYASVGLSGFFDLARAIDPNDTGKWGVDSGFTGTFSCAALATLSGTAVASAAFFQYNVFSSNGVAVAGGAAVPCVVYPYPGTGGSGAVVTATPHASNPVFASLTVTSGGTGYTYPPMIASQGAWTNDGVHPATRGWCEVIKACGVMTAGSVIAPETFSLWP